MTSIKLWYSPGACSLAVHILLKEAGLPFEGISISVRQGAPEALRKINPKMRVPICAIDEQIVTEVPAIMTAIAQLAPERQLLGSSNLNIVQSTVHGQAFGGLLRPARYSDDPDMYDAIRKKSWQTVQECFDAIEEKLKGVHAVGNGFTVVDPYLYVFYRWGASNDGLDMAARYPKYAKLVGELLERRAVREAVEAEGIEPQGPKL
ncbi:hypothetical protein LTR70_009789 [Exophiala xenobiotica]|uniref:Glutathione S-transferase n=1 Tax=Lithohypha guttulata TaxID=1690604 RepID=A0ABR0JVK6_9EURO|nr:hypothetical protein LTR24_009914 [Lithohypha guttulata]KAK5310038.1 hypothetical protein LTR70_009789 [Exophiala xenobiotica]